MTSVLTKKMTKKERTSSPTSLSPKRRRRSKNNQAERPLWQSEEYYRTLVEESFDGVFIQKGTKIVFANQRLNDMLDYNRNEMEGMDHWLVYHPDYQDLTRERAQARMLGKKIPPQYEVKLLRKDGSSFEGEINAKAILLGNEPGIQVWIRDITERKQAEEALKRKEEESNKIAQENTVIAEIGRIISSTLNIEEVYERFAEEVRKLIRFERLAVNLINFNDQTLSMAYTTGLDVAERRAGTTIPLNGSFTEHVMLTRSGVLVQGKNLQEGLEHFRGLVFSFMKGLQSFMSVPLVSKDQVIGVLDFRSTEANAYSEVDLKLAEKVGHQIAGAIANAQLFAERNKVEEALRESEKKFKDLYDNAPLGYHEYDTEGRITNVNQTDLEMLGYTAEEMIGQFMWKFNVEEEDAREQILAKLSGALPPGQNLERTYRRKDGTTIPVLIEDKLVLNEKGQVKGIRCLIQDITQRKQIEEAFRKSEEQAKRLALENQVVAEISRIIGSTLNINEVYERFAEEVQKLVRFERLAINLINSKDHTLTVPYTFGVDIAERRQGVAATLTGSFTEEVTVTRSNIIIQGENLKQYLYRFPGLLHSYHAGLQSFLSVPLISNDQAIGALHFRTSKVNAYTETDLRLAERVGHQIAGAIANAQLFSERNRAEKEQQKLILQLQEALLKVKTLKGLIPICASCKKIRDDKGYWNQLETYIHHHSEAEFSHGICPECFKRLYPDLCEVEDNKNQ
jgi:PAS domain S-box-containing protein